MSPDRAVPTVGIAVYYDVGSRNEVRGRSGFAHLFEHMMFQGSANVAKGEHFALVMNRGGKPYNAFLEGRVKGDSYALLLHMSNMELKRPKAIVED